LLVVAMAGDVAVGTGDRGRVDERIDSAALHS
jgi:hypothetical protein